MSIARLALACLALLLVDVRPSSAQLAENGARKRADAVRVADGAIRLDGRLDDLGWQGVAPLTDFLQRQPVEGAEPTDPMEVRFVYDGAALYVGARMYSDGPT